MSDSSENPYTPPAEVPPPGPAPPRDKSGYYTAPVPSRRMPGGIPYIVGNEAAERFSFYGMRTILVIFMTRYLMSSQGGQSPMTPDEAKVYFHVFVLSAYFFPILGAIISDAVLGKYRTILALSIVYCLGHLSLAVDETRLGLFLGLALIAIGSGGIKPCVSAHVGDQFGPANQHLISKVFAWFYFAINLGSFASTLLTPWLLEKYGPSVAFGVPGGLMLLATWVFWLGRRKFIHVPAGGFAAVKEAFSGEGLRAILNLSLIYLFVVPFWSLFDQTGSAWVLQATRMNLNWLGVEWLPSQVQAANPALVMVLIPLFAYVVYPAISRVFPLTPLRKIAIGLFITVPAFALPAWIESRITGGDVVQVTSQAEPNRWAAQRLLDGGRSGRGWVSLKREAHRLEQGKKFFPQEIVIRLRERRAWEIDAVAIDPKLDWKRFFEDTDQTTADESPAEHAQKCLPSEIDVLVGESPVGPWSSVGQFNFAGSDREQTLSFPPVSTEYVMIRIASNGGGEYVGLGQVRVLASSSAPPGGADAAAEKIWPDVAAIGEQPSIVWQLVAYVLMTAAEIMVSITCLEFSYTQAPRKMKSFIMAVFLLSISAGNLLTSVVNGVIQNEDKTSKLEGAAYYWFFSGLMLATAVLFLVVVRFYRGRTYIQGDDQSPPAG